MPQIVVDRDGSGKRRPGAPLLAAACGLAIGAGLAALLVAVDRLAPRAPRAAAPVAPEEDSGPIFIGEFGSMTGPASPAGLALHAGARAAIDERNAAGGIDGRRVEVRVLDDRSRPEAARLAVARLEKEDRPAAILVSTTGEIAAAGAAAGRRATLLVPEGRADEDLGRALALVLLDALERCRTFSDSEVAAAIASANPVGLPAGSVAVERAGPTPGGAEVLRVRLATAAPILPPREDPSPR